MRMFEFERYFYYSYAYAYPRAYDASGLLVLSSK